MLTLVLHALLLMTVCIEARHVVHFYNASRDYLEVTSESYPKTYPAGNRYTWEWFTPLGFWGVYFVDFDLVCEDVLDIGDTTSHYFYRCGNEPPEIIIFENSFRMELDAKTYEHHIQSQGFKCHVFYGATKDDVKSKINTMKAMGTDLEKAKNGESSGLSGIVIALILIIVLLIIAVSLVACVIVRRRRQHCSQQTTTNTSVHVNIEGIRRESSVSYTRNGGGARTRLESEDSLPENPTSSKPRRPVKRSESNASWAARAEMATSSRNGSCSGEGHYGNTTVLNFYSRFPTETSTTDGLGDKDPSSLGNKDPCGLGNKDPASLGDKDLGGLGEKEAPGTSTTGRLSSISEESSASKLRCSLPVPMQMEDTSLAVVNAGYMVMSGCTGNYMNYGGE